MNNERSTYDNINISIDKYINKIKELEIQLSNSKNSLILEKELNKKFNLEIKELRETNNKLKIKKLCNSELFTNENANMLKKENALLNEDIKKLNKELKLINDKYQILFKDYMNRLDELFDKNICSNNSIKELLINVNENLNYKMNNLKNNKEKINYNGISNEYKNNDNNTKDNKNLDMQSNYLNQQKNVIINEKSEKSKHEKVTLNSLNFINKTNDVDKNIFNSNKDKVNIKFIDKNEINPIDNNNGNINSSLLNNDDNNKTKDLPNENLLNEKNANYKNETILSSKDRNTEKIENIIDNSTKNNYNYDKDNITDCNTKPTNDKTDKETKHQNNVKYQDNPRSPFKNSVIKSVKSINKKNLNKDIDWDELIDPITDTSLNHAANLNSITQNNSTLNFGILNNNNNNNNNYNNVSTTLNKSIVKKTIDDKKIVLDNKLNNKPNKKLVLDNKSFLNDIEDDEDNMWSNIVSIDNKKTTSKTKIDSKIKADNNLIKYNINTVKNNITNNNLKPNTKETSTIKNKEELNKPITFTNKKNKKFNNIDILNDDIDVDDNMFEGFK